MEQEHEIFHSTLNYLETYHYIVYHNLYEVASSMLTNQNFLWINTKIDGVFLAYISNFQMTYILYKHFILCFNCKDFFKITCSQYVHIKINAS